MKNVKYRSDNVLKKLNLCKYTITTVKYTVTIPANYSMSQYKYAV